MPDHAYFSAQEIAHDPYYQEFMRPRGFGWNVIAALHGDLLVSVKRAFKRGPYEGAELQALNDALPWLRCVRFGDGLDVVGGFLRVPRAADRDGLRKFLSALALSAERRCSRAPSTLTLPRPSGARPWLLAGESLQAAAARLSISEGHARKRLKAVFHKTRTSWQGELIALLAKFA